MAIRPPRQNSKPLQLPNAAAARVAANQFPALAGFRRKLLYTTKEVLKPKVSSGVFRKPPKRRLWRMKRGGFEEVSRFPCHNVAGNQLTRRRKLFVAADKKYAAGGNRKSHSSATIGKSCRPLTTKKRALKPPVSGLPFSLHTTLTSAAASYSTATAPPSPDRRVPAGTDPFRGSRCPR